MNHEVPLYMIFHTESFKIVINRNC